MPETNPYQPSETSPFARVDFTREKRPLWSFLIVQFLTFVPTFVVVTTATFFLVYGWWRGSVGVILGSPILVAQLAGVGMLAWIPHAFTAAISIKVRCGGAWLNGIVGATCYVECGITLVHFNMGKKLVSQVGPINILCLLISLVAVALLGLFRSKYKATRRNQAEFFET